MVLKYYKDCALYISVYIIKKDLNEFRVCPSIQGIIHLCLLLIF